jgi:hypothetical protein
MSHSRSTGRQLAIAWSIALSVVLVPALVLGGLRFFSAEKAHDDALARWKSKEPTAYSFDFSHCSGLCQGCTTRVTVKAGKVISAVGTGPRGCSDFDANDAPTIEDVFDLEKSGRSNDEFDSVEIQYDPTWGFPASVSLRCPEGTADCGTGFSVTNFRVEP